MAKIRKSHIAGALFFGLIIVTASFVALSLSTLEWPFASASPFSPNPYGGPKPPEGILLINASHLLNGVKQPIPNASISLLTKKDNRLLETNSTNSRGLLLYLLPPGGYSVNIGTRFGSASGSVDVSSDHDAVLNYLSVNETIGAISFDISTQQPNIVAPWDTIYVELPSQLNGLNLTRVGVFVEPGYFGFGNSSGPARSFGIPLFPKNIFQIPATVVSEQILPSGTSFWLQLRAGSVFSTNNLAALNILEFNSTVTVESANNITQFG